jgi:hypothetical protein
MITESYTDFTTALIGRNTVVHSSCNFWNVETVLTTWADDALTPMSLRSGLTTVDNIRTTRVPSDTSGLNRVTSSWNGKATSPETIPPKALTNIATPSNNGRSSPPTETSRWPREVMASRGPSSKKPVNVRTVRSNVFKSPTRGENNATSGWKAINIADIIGANTNEKA